MVVAVVAGVVFVAAVVVVVVGLVVVAVFVAVVVTGFFTVDAGAAYINIMLSPPCFKSYTIP